MSPSYQILSHFRHCWPNKKPCSQGATTTYLRRGRPRRRPTGEPLKNSPCLNPKNAKQSKNLTSYTSKSQFDTDRSCWPATAGLLSFEDDRGVGCDRRQLHNSAAVTPIDLKF